MTPRDVPAREGAWTMYVCPDTGEAVEVDDGCPHVHWNRDELEPVQVIPFATAERLAEALASLSFEAQDREQSDAIRWQTLAAFRQATGSRATEGGTDG